MDEGVEGVRVVDGQHKNKGTPPDDKTERSMRLAVVQAARVQESPIRAHPQVAATIGACKRPGNNLQCALKAASRKSFSAWINSHPQYTPFFIPIGAAGGIEPPMDTG